MYPFLKEVSSSGLQMDLEKGGGYRMTQMTSVYVYHLLDTESDNWTLRYYPMPNTEEEKSLLNEELRLFRPTLAWSAGGTTMTVIRFEDEVGDNLVARGWGDLRVFSIERMSGKIAKRLSALAWQTYLHYSWSDVSISHGIAEVDVEGQLTGKVTGTLPQDTEDNLSILVFTLPDGVHESVIDGNSYMRPSLRDKLNAQMHERFALNDEARADALFEEFARSEAFNARGIFGLGELKGDLLCAVADHVLPADLVVWEGNIKPEIITQDGRFVFEMFPQEQQERVRSNRQTLANFYQPLYEGIIEPALIDHIDHLISVGESGKMPGFMNALLRGEEDSMGTYQKRFLKFRNSGLPLTDSFHLSEFCFGQVTNMLHPMGRAEDKRKFPVPFSKRVSLRSVADLKFTGRVGPDFNLPKGEGKITDIGIVVRDDEFPAIASVLGGADKDDHIEVAYRWLFDMLVLVLIRCPIGFTSNGTDIASEYWIVKATLDEETRAFEQYGEYNIPHLDLELMPKRSDKIVYPADSYKTSQRVLPSTYTKAETQVQMDASIADKGSYGGHCNVRMIAASHKVPLPHSAREDEFADSCQQTRVPADLLKVALINRKEAEILARKVVFDPIEYKRVAGLMKGLDVQIEPGFWSNLAEVHQAEIDRYEAAMLVVKREIKVKKEQQLAPYLPSVKPLLIRRIDEVSDSYAKEMRKSRFGFQDFSNIGDRVVALMDHYKVAQDVRIQCMLEALAWSYKHKGTDAPLMQGALIDLAIAALQSLPQ